MKGVAWGTIKSTLLGIAIIVAIIIAIEYLSSIQLLWVAIIFIVVLISAERNRISSIAAKLGYIEKDKEQLIKSITDYDFMEIRSDQIKSRIIDSDGIFVKNIIADDMNIANCIRIVRKGDEPYLYIYGNNEADGTVIGIKELRQLLILLKAKELVLGEITEEDFILKAIAERKKWIEELVEYKEEKLKEGKEYSWPDSDINKIEKEIEQLQKWLEELRQNLDEALLF